MARKEEKRGEINEIVAYVNDFFASLDMDVVENPKIEFEGDF